MLQLPLVPLLWCCRCAWSVVTGDSRESAGGQGRKTVRCDGWDGAASETGRKPCFQSFHDWRRAPLHSHKVYNLSQSAANRAILTLLQLVIMLCCVHKGACGRYLHALNAVNHAGGEFEALTVRFGTIS